MKTLKQMYEELIHNKDEWSYYNYPPDLSVKTLCSPVKACTQILQNLMRKNVLFRHIFV